MAPSIADIRTGYELKRKNRFMLTFPGDVGGRALQASVRSSARPTWQVNPVELHHLNTRWWVPGKANWVEWRCTFYDFKDDNTLQELFRWYRLVYDPNTTIMQAPYVVKKEVRVDALGGGLEEDIIESYELFGTWPTNIEGGDLDMTSEGEPMDLTVTFRYDYALLL